MTQQDYETGIRLLDRAIELLDEAYEAHTAERSPKAA